MSAPLISSQRHLDHAIVERKASRFQVFVVRTMDVELRGKAYRVLLDGHHNLAAAKLAGVEPTWRGPSAKTKRVRTQMPSGAFENMLINNLTDADWYYVDSGEVVSELQASDAGSQS
ncbi:tudor domain-containing protein [Herminiimonas contaminans]|uniref:ParB-like nuclease family protein n=1 Tax=Herminiimonas contaminans TaxID=1111140 RepID=A0ABS0ES71_9BURK|nr:hypothetical protein [Herminiimonas contaminans]MBF8177698.1 hypothetical protein [Herminiimonas contaminans]